MKRLQYLFFVTCLVIFFLYAVYVIVTEGKKCSSTFKRLNGLSTHQKRSRVIGDLYNFATRCNTIIPEDANILFLSNITNNQLSYDLYLNYYLYPRKLFWLNNVSPYPESPPELEDLDRAFLSGRNINWVILRYPKGYGVNQLIKIENGRALQSFDLN